MRATRQILGCALCVAVVGSAAAATLDAQGMDQVTQAASNRSSHDSDTTGADAARMSHDSSGAHSGATSSPSRNGNDRSAAASSAPAPAAHPHLGWQSLLPGSIQ
ncbi:MAG: hypothetical protein ABI389_07065 [Rhodanobacter sp.]